MERLDADVAMAGMGRIERTAKQTDAQSGLFGPMTSGQLFGYGRHCPVPRTMYL